MDAFNQIFGYYDKLIAPLSPGMQALVSFILLLVLLWQVYMIIKSGHWIFIALLVILLPGTWPAAKEVGRFFLMILEFLWLHARMIVT